MGESKGQIGLSFAASVRGHTSTDFDPLPAGWKAVRLGQYIEQSSRKNRENKALPVYSVSNKVGFVLSDEFFDKQVYSRDLSTYKVVNTGYFAYNPYRINVGSLALFREDAEGLVSPAYVVFRLADKSEMRAEYLYFLLKSDRYVSEIQRLSMSRGSVRRSLSFKDLAEVQIPLPSLHEQEEIAHVLRTVQKAIEATDKVIQASRELKRSLMNHLFTYGPVPVDEAEQVPLKNTEIGLMPASWSLARIDDLFDWQLGKMLSPAAKRGISPRPYLRNLNVQWGKVDVRDTVSG